MAEFIFDAIWRIHASLTGLPAALEVRASGEAGYSRRHFTGFGGSAELHSERQVRADRLRINVIVGAPVV